MSIRLPDIDGEWELWNGDGVSDEWDRSNFRILKRIPPKEKSLRQVLNDPSAIFTDALCDKFEALERRVEELEKIHPCLKEGKHQDMDIPNEVKKIIKNLREY